MDLLSQQGGLVAAVLAALVGLVALVRSWRRGRAKAPARTAPPPEDGRATASAATARAQESADAVSGIPPTPDTDEATQALLRRSRGE